MLNTSMGVNRGHVLLFIFYSFRERICSVIFLHVFFFNYKFLLIFCVVFFITHSLIDTALFYFRKLFVVFYFNIGSI